jgi:hypothetical protein
MVTSLMVTKYPKCDNSKQTVMSKFNITSKIMIVISINTDKTKVISFLTSLTNLQS